MLNIILNFVKFEEGKIQDLIALLQELYLLTHLSCMLKLTRVVLISLCFNLKQIEVHLIQIF